MLVGAVAALASDVPFPWVVLAAGLLGSVLLPTPAALAATDSGSALPQTGSGALRHVAIVASVAAIIWGACLWVVTATHAAGGRGAEIARLFTTMTLLSLGGAYAVVPWALDESVARGWLDTGERFTALAMGEATPGPLILVVTFIGFMAGWRAGGESMLPAGLAGAAIATLFAFLPSFALIFGCAPFARSIHVGSRLGRAMTGVGTAVVAAILMLTLRLATDAFLPTGSVDPLAIVVALASAAAPPPRPAAPQPAQSCLFRSRHSRLRLAKAPNRYDPIFRQSQRHFVKRIRYR